MKTALIIPAYKPGKEMLALLEQFAGREDFLPIVVDDGSGEDYRAIFDALPGGVELLRHPQNRGKGAALKTAIAHVLENCPDCGIALTADADGQHTFEDILRIRDSAQAHPGALVLGSRQFEGEVPFRSRWGNGITRQVFAIASGRKIYDTQTGLRAFDRGAMRRFAEISGDRYEYEINMLLDAAQSGMDIVEEKIATVYLNDNASSHFNPFRDSLKIYLCILRYVASSLIAFVVDWALVEILVRALTGGMGAKRALTAAQVIARVVSATVNFVINKKMVFRSREDWRPEAVRYGALAVAVLAANVALMKLFNGVFGWNHTLSYLLIQVIMYITNFILQGKLVYRRGDRKGN